MIRLAGGGRPQVAGRRPGDTKGRATRRVVGPEDRADFSPGDSSRLQAWEADLQRREQELRRQSRTTRRRRLRLGEAVTRSPTLPAHGKDPHRPVDV